MLTRIAPFVGALALVSSTLAAQTFVPSVAVSVRDTDLDGLGDGFNAAPFNTSPFSRAIRRRQAAFLRPPARSASRGIR